MTQCQYLVHFKMLSVAAVLSLVAAAQGHALAPNDEIKPTYGGEIIDMGDIPDLIKTPINYGKDPLPDSWDWRKLGLMTTDLNQHIPQYWYFFCSLSALFLIFLKWFLLGSRFDVYHR